MNLKLTVCFFLILIGCSALVIDKDFQSFTDYERKFNLNFAPEERLQRFAVFKENLVRIEKWNKEMPSAKFGITKFTHLTDAEISQLVMTPSSEDSTKGYSGQVLPSSGPIPDYFDWRDHNYVTPVKNQQSCGDCYAFAAVAVVETMNAINGGPLTNLSEQQITDCDTNSFGCNGGYVSTSFDLAQEVGLVPAEDYPFENEQGECRTPANSPRVTIRGRIWLPANEYTIAQMVYYNGPVVISIYCPRALFNYVGGVFDMDAATCASETVGNHAIVIVGFKDDHWIIKNSWGTYWGDEGYLLAARGGNFCNMTRQPQIAYW